MPRKAQFLELHRGQYRVVVSVPRDLHSQLGTKLKRSLGTDSLTTADALKWSVVTELKRQIEEARRGGNADPLRKEATQYREALTKARTENEIDALRYALAIRAEQIAGKPVEVEAVGNEEHPVFDPQRAQQAKQFADMAQGLATPLDAYLSAFHAENLRSAGVKADDLRALEMLAEWCRKAAIPPFVEAIEPRTAGRFVSEALFPGKARKTVNKYVSSLSAYWRWMIKKGYLEANPWREKSLPKARQAEDEAERAFTDEEVLKLLNGKPTGYLGPLMKIAALTGARIDAIASLKVRDMRDGMFRFKPQKRETGHRLVPIHSTLRATIEELTKDKGDEDDLFPELPPPPAGSERHRSNPAVQRFGTYRKSLGIDDRVAGKRSSRVTFHSFRRWFITKAEQAGIAPHIIASVVGHKRQGMTLGLYSGGPSREQLTECVEAVKLPEGVKL
ncbi:MAG: tyrosine-type recombinase/integrase [Beijerinckiaceae bacterium]|nr:tyrosine-type recombinase/integrase [Beijerinckiaceae bacterium]